MERSKEVKKVDLGTGSVGKFFFQLALPAITVQVINMLYNVADHMYIDHLSDEGAHASTGVDVTFPVIMAISAFAALVSMGGAPRASIMLGKDGKEETENILGDCITAPITVVAVLTAFFPIFDHSILLMFGASDDTIEYGWAYMQIYPLGTIFVQLTPEFNAFIDTQGYTETGMYTVFIGAICNTILGPTLIFMFHMGVRDVALATIISQEISAVWVVLFLISNRSYLKVHTCYIRPKRGVLIPAIALGAASSVTQLTESILNICFSISPLKCGGDMAVEAMTTMGSVMQFSLLPLQGLTQDVQLIISFNYGAKKLDRVSRTFWLLLTSCLTYFTVLWAVAIFVPMVYIRIFTHDAALTDFSEQSIRICAAVPLLFGVRLVCQQTFIAIGSSKTSLSLVLLRKIIPPVLLIYILPNIFENKVFAVFVVEPIADTIVTCTTVALFILTFRKMKQKLGAYAQLHPSPMIGK